MKAFFEKNKKIVITVFVVILLVLICLISYVKIMGKDISSNGVKAIILPSVVYTDNVSGVYVNKGSKVKVRATLRYFGRSKYYYQHSVYSGNTVVKTMVCTQVKGGDYTEYVLNMNLDNIKIGTKIYKDNKCSKNVANYSSLTYKLKTDNSVSSTKKTFTATFKKNGATSIGSESLSCSTTGNSCVVTAPSITRNGYTVVGWGTSVLLTSAKYKVGEKITLTKNTTFYAITKKASQSTSNATIKMSKFSDNWKVGTTGKLTVTTIPSNLSVTVTSSNTSVMTVEKTKNAWRLSAVGPGKATITAKASNGKSISYTYTVTGSYLSGIARLKRGGKLIKTVNGVNVYAEKTCKNDVINKYIADLSEQPTFVKDITKNVYLVSYSTYKQLNPQSSKNALASSHLVQYSADISCDVYYIGILPHELGHIFDYKYKVYMEGDYISNSSVWSNLYTKYYKKAMRTDYSTFDNKQEFFADAYTFYFQKVLAKTNPIQNGYYKNYKYPNEIKNQMASTLETLNKLNMK